MMRLIQVIDETLMNTGEYFLRMAAACAAGIVLFVVGGLNDSGFLMTVGLLLQVPFWLWAIPFCGLFVYCLVVGLCVIVAYHFGFLRDSNEEGEPYDTLE